MWKRKVNLRTFDASRYLDTEESVAAYLAEALETNDAEFISEANSTVARARGMTQLVKTSGVSREQRFGPAAARYSKEKSYADVQGVSRSPQGGD